MGGEGEVGKRGEGAVFRNTAKYPMQINAKFFQNSKICTYFSFYLENRNIEKSPAGGDLIFYSFKNFSGEIVTKLLGDEEKEVNPSLVF